MLPRALSCVKIYHIIVSVDNSIIPVIHHAVISFIILIIRTDCDVRTVSYADIQLAWTAPKLNFGQEKTI